MEHIKINRERELFAGDHYEVLSLGPLVNVRKPGFVYYWELQDWEPHNAHWRGPSWLGIKADGTREMGAAYLANMRRNEGIIDNGELMNFVLYWQMFNFENERIWYDGVALVQNLGYKKFVENVARQWPGGAAYQDLVTRSTSCSIERFITTHMSPPGETLPIIDIPWNP